MRIGNRLFPYPTLNREDSLTEYGSLSKFELVFDSSPEGELPKTATGQVLKNVRFDLTDARLLELYRENKVKCGLIVESAASTYRVMHDLTMAPQDIHLNNADLKGAVNVSAYLWATEDIKGYRSDDFKSDYASYSFDIEKYDILAIDDGFKFQVNIDPADDNKMPSIFTIVPKDSSEKQMSYDTTASNIIISLPYRYYQRYDNIKGKADFKNVMFSIIAIPALAGSLADIKAKFGEDGEIDDVTEQFRWFRAVCKRYAKVTGSELTSEAFTELNPMELAQIVLNDAPCNGIEEFSDFLLHGKEREDEDE